MQTKSFEGKVAAITGAGSGIGRALAVALARRGCELALSDVDERGLAETVAATGSVRTTARRVDVTSPGQVTAWASATAAAHGRVNLVFNNAGISYGATVQGMGDAEFHRVMDVDFWGVVHGTRAFLPLLEASGDGHVVNVSSLFGLVAFPGQCAYNSAKFAVRGFTEALQIELLMTKAKVHATCIHPGGVRTNIARSSKAHPSLAALGVNVETASRDMERSFITSADAAAGIILRGVQRNARRVLVGADAHALDIVQRIFPGRYHAMLARLAQRILARRKRPRSE